MNFRRSRFLAALLSVTIVSPTLASAATPSVVVPPLESPANRRASSAVAKVLRESGRVSVVDGAAVDRYLKNRKKPSAEMPKNGSEASVALAKGQEAYQALKMKEAVEHLTNAKLLYRKQLSTEEAFQGLRAAQFHLAMAYLAEKDGARAKEELREIVVLDPERKTRKLSEKLYPPTIRDLYIEVREEVERKPAADLEIVTTPPEALVYLDGKAQGATPLHVNGLPTGEHFIRIQKEGTEGYFGSKFVVEGENRVEAELKPSVSGDLYSNFGTVGSSAEIDPRRAAFLDEMGLTLGADIIVFLTPDVAKMKGQLYDQRSQEISAVEVDATPQGLVSKLVASLDREGYVTRKPAAAPAPSRETGRTELPSNLQPDAEGTLAGLSKAPAESAAAKRGKYWYENPWIWTAVGVVVLGGAGVLLFTDVGKTGPSKSTLTVRVP